MELDELRRHWQQPELVAAPPLPTGSELSALQKGRTAGLVDKMRLAARLEAGFTVVLGVGLLLALPQVHGTLKALHRGYIVLSLGLVAVLLLYYYRMLGILRRMLEPADSVRGHLSALAQGLRQLLKFYYRLTLAAGPASLLVGFAYYVGRELARTQPVRWVFLGGLALALLLMGALIQVGAVYFMRWYLQRLYGCHLDRLESQLRELDEFEPAA